MAIPAPKPRLTDRERHSRFVAMAHEVEAAKNLEAFDRGFERVAHPPSENPGGRG